MKTILNILFVLFTSICLSQEYPKKVIIENDTCIVFTLEQSRKLILWDVELGNCKEENLILNEESKLKDSIIEVNKQIAIKYAEIEQLYTSIKSEKDEIIKTHIEEKELLEKQIKKYKRQRFLSTTLGVITTSVLTTLILLK